MGKLASRLFYGTFSAFDLAKKENKPSKHTYMYLKTNLSDACLDFLVFTTCQPVVEECTSVCDTFGSNTSVTVFSLFGDSEAASAVSGTLGTCVSILLLMEDDGASLIFSDL